MGLVLQSVMFGVIAAVCWGIADFLAAVISKRLGILGTVFGVHVASVAATTIYLVFALDPAMPSPGQWAALVGMSLLAVVTYLAFYKSLQIGPVAVVSPIVSTYAVVVILLAVIFVGERLSAGQSIGAIGTVVGIVVASTNPRALRRRETLIGAGVLLAILATLGLGFWQFAIGVLSKEIGWFLPIYISRVLTLAFLLPIVVARRTWPWRQASALLILGVIVVGIVETAGLFAFARGSEVGIISIVAAASITYPVIPVLGGLAIFKERLSISQWSGLTIALVGLLVLTLAG